MPKEAVEVVNEAVWEVDESGSMGYYCEACRVRVGVELQVEAAVWHPRRIFYVEIVKIGGVWSQSEG